MARFDSAIALAKRLIDKNGQDADLRTFVAGPPPDANKPWEPGVNVPSDQTVRAVFLPLGKPGTRLVENVYADGTLVREGDLFVLIASTDKSGNPVDVDIGGIIYRSSEPWKIQASSPLSPNGQLIMFSLQVSQ